MYLFLVKLSLFASLAVVCMGASAQSKRIAFVVGNAKYQNESPLANPHNDARLVSRTLKNDLAFDEVIERFDLTRSQLYDLVGDVGRRARGADAVVVYYSGHGMRGPGGNFLIPVDARISEEEHVRRDALPASELVDALQNTNARVALLVLDACRDSPYSRRTRSTTKGLARMNVSGGNLLVAYATSEGNTADDGAGSNSPYAKALADALKQSKPVLAQLDEVRRVVRQSTQNKQNPTREGDLEVNVYLINPPTNISSARHVSAQDSDQFACDAARNSGTKSAWRAYLNEFSSGRCAAAARVALAEPELRVVPAPATQMSRETSSKTHASKVNITASGLKLEDVIVGTGAEARSGQTATVHYTGWLWVDGTRGGKFDSSKDRGVRFEFPIGGGRVIKGWDEGIQGMRIGGTRILTIPPHLGYGDRGAGKVIPPGATLQFEVELFELR